MNTKDISMENFYWHITVYAKAKSGKLTFAASFPKPYVFDFEGGLTSIKGKDVEYDRYTSPEVMRVKINGWAANPSSCPFQTLIVKSLSSLEIFVLDELMQLANKKEPSLPLYGGRISWLEHFIMSVTKLPFNTILIAHEEVEKNELTGEIIKRPLICGKQLPCKLPMFVDEVYYITVGRDEKGNPLHKLITKGNESLVAGSKLGIFPQSIDLPAGKSGYEILNEYFRGMKK